MAEVDGQDAHQRQIVFNLQAPDSGHDPSALEEERDKHRKRAERFSTQYRDPGRVRKDFGLMMEARREKFKQQHGFTTGNLDLLSKEEADKRASRASRFQLEAPLPAAAALDARGADSELEARARRAARFGVAYQPTEAVLMDMDLFEARREVASSVARRATAIYLYGVDVMSTKEVLSYFGEYGPVFVEWLDDSSCNVLFEDANSVRRALAGKGAPLPPEVITEERYQQQHGEAETAAAAQAAAAAEAARIAAEEQGPGAEADAAAAAAEEAAAAAQVAARAAAAARAGLGAPAAVRYQPELPVPDNLADVGNLPYIWHKGRDFIKNGTPVSLVYRMATAADVRDMSAPKRTRELWKAAGGGGGRGGGRGGRRGGKRPYRREPGDTEGGPEDMEVDDGPGAGQDGDGDVPMKRQRGVRGGRNAARSTLSDVRRNLRPYGGEALLVPGPTAAVLPATGHVLDYTELEDEGAAVPERNGGIAEPIQEGCDLGGGGRGGRGGRRGRGRGRGRGGWAGDDVHGDEGEAPQAAPHFEGDLRDVLKARRRAALEAAEAARGHRDADAGHEAGAGDGEEGYAGEK